MKGIYYPLNNVQYTWWNIACNTIFFILFEKIKNVDGCYNPENRLLSQKKKSQIGMKNGAGYEWLIY